MAKPKQSHNPAASYIWCEQCERPAYFARADARTVRNNAPAAKLSIFPCPHTESRFHLGHRPPELSSGNINRRTQALTVAALRTGYANTPLRRHGHVD